MPVVSPAIDFKSEGFVTGMAAKMFTVAGPVIVFGTVASVLYGCDFEALPTLKLPGFFANKGRPCPAWTAFVHHKPWEPFRLLRWAAKMFSVILSWSASFISRNWQPYSRGPSSFSMTRST